ncbi:MAG: amidohydrolase family protein [Candidatus Sumerlaeaceae bacterium]|nr:amidohydrolase family protein [Candidatus Sumerlaeaceae bacterium]
MAIVLTNAVLADLDPLGIEHTNLKIEGDRIVARGGTAKAGAGDEEFDCGGAVVLPGLVNGHTHLYSALACGMPAPPKNPTNFHEILLYVWWRLDRALDGPSIEMSARIGALEALRCGTTTLIDHHASPNHIDGSLDLMEQGIAKVGLRGVLCYEITDRNGHDGTLAGIAETRRYTAKVRGAHHGQFAALIGAHAAFTCSDLTLHAVRELSDEYGVGVHIHVAEDACDDAICRKQYGASLLSRLQHAGIVRSDSIFGHGIHLDPAAIEAVNLADVTMAHNTRSNMNNAVGYAPLDRLVCPVILGTDGIGGDMFAESKTAWFKSRDGDAGKSPAQIIQMLTNAARRASKSLGVTLGKLEPGAAADVVITDYRPSTPLTSENLAGHFIFGMDSRHVCHVIAGGRWAMRDRVVETCDEAASRAEAVEITRRLWERMQGLK